MNSRHFRRIAVLLAAAVTLLGPVAAQAIPKMGQPLPALDVTTTGGQRVTNQNYTGKVLLVAFSTDYCPGCKKAVPGISSMASRYGKQGFHAIGLLSGFGMENDDLKEYMKTYGATYPMALIEQRTMESQFGVVSVPYFLLVSKKGMVAGMYRGFSDGTMKQMEEQIKKLLAE